MSLVTTRPYSSGNAALDATAKLPKETYLTLLKEGRELALSTKQEPPWLVEANGNNESSTSKEKNLADRVKSTTNVVDSTGSTQLAEFLETTVENVQNDRIKLGASNWKGSVCVVVHVQFSNTQQTKDVLTYSRATGLIHRGRQQHRTGQLPTMLLRRRSNIPHKWAIPEICLPRWRNWSRLEDEIHNGLFGNISCDGYNSIDSNGHAADLVTGLLGPSPSNTAEEPKDPFEGLLWL